jgi:hypothetical protein
MSQLHEEAGGNHKYTVTIIGQPTKIRTEYNIFGAVCGNTELLVSNF